MAQNILVAHWVRLHECCSSDAQYLRLHPTMVMSKKARGQGGHFTPLQPARLAAEVGKQVVLAGTQL